MSQSLAVCIINSYRFIDKKICGWLFINNLLLYWTSEKTIRRKGICSSSVSTIFHLQCRMLLSGDQVFPAQLWASCCDEKHLSLGGKPALCYSQVKGSVCGENQSLMWHCRATVAFPPTAISASDMGHLMRPSPLPVLPLSHHQVSVLG